MSTPNYRPGLGDETGRVIRHPQGHGYCEYRYGPAGTCEIVNIEVDEHHRGKGIGTAMLKELLADPLVKIVYAFTAEDNERAHAWYVKQGFELTRVPQLYGRKLSAFVCVLVVRK